jgi:hypothetical protein
MVLIYQIQDAVQPITIGMTLHKVVRECGSMKMPLDVLNSTHPTTVLHVIMTVDSSWPVKAHSFVAHRDITMILINRVVAMTLLVRHRILKIVHFTLLN